MKASIHEIENYSSENVIMYTVQLDGMEITEFQNFQQRMAEKYPVDLGEINKKLDQIKLSNEGAEKRFFKKQRDADRLLLPTPPEFDKNKPDPKSYGLRIYTVWISPKTVFLLNGDLKTYAWAQNCPNCGKFFDSANQVALAIYAAIYLNEIEIDDEGYVLIDNDYKLIIT